MNMPMHLTAHPSIMAEPEQGPVQLVAIHCYPWGYDFSWNRHITCRNHPSARYNSKNPWARQLHLIAFPTDENGVSTLRECPCPLADLAVVVPLGTEEQTELIAGRLAAHKQDGCDPNQMIFEGTYGAPGFGQAWRCGYCGKPWANIDGTFIAEEEGAHLLTVADVR